VAGSDVWSTASGSTIRRGVPSNASLTRGGPLAGTPADFDDDLIDDVSVEFASSFSIVN